MTGIVSPFGKVCAASCVNIPPARLICAMAGSLSGVGILTGDPVDLTALAAGERSVTIHAL